MSAPLVWEAGRPAFLEGWGQGETGMAACRWFEVLGSYPQHPQWLQQQRIWHTAHGGNLGVLEPLAPQLLQFASKIVLLLRVTTQSKSSHFEKSQSKGVSRGKTETIFDHFVLREKENSIILVLAATDSPYIYRMRKTHLALLDNDSVCSQL